MALSTNWNPLKTNFFRFFSKPIVEWQSDNLYRRLGVKPDASPDEIKKKYYELARAYHPDTTSDPKEKEEFSEIITAVNSAWDVLKDEAERAKYDQSLNPQSSLFNEMLFRVHRTTIKLSFMEGINGGQKKISYSTPTPCSSCHGTCTASGEKPTMCSYCNGTGISGHAFIPIPCQVCGGRGFFISDPCPTCSGTGNTSCTQEVSVDLPPALDNGSVFTIQTEHGQVAVTCLVGSDPLLTREGMDLYVTVPVSIKTAILGGYVNIPTLKGVVQKRVLPGIQPNSIERLHGAGIQGVGDLYVTYKVIIPKELDDEQKKLMESLNTAYMNTIEDMWQANLNAYESRNMKS